MCGIYRMRNHPDTIVHLHTATIYYTGLCTLEHLFPPGRAWVALGCVDSLCVCVLCVCVVHVIYGD